MASKYLPVCCTGCPDLGIFVKTSTTAAAAVVAMVVAVEAALLETVVGLAVAVATAVLMLVAAVLFVVVTSVVIQVAVLASVLAVAMLPAALPVSPVALSVAVALDRITEHGLLHPGLEELPVVQQETEFVLARVLFEHLHSATGFLVLPPVTQRLVVDVWQERLVGPQSPIQY